MTDKKSPDFLLLFCLVSALWLTVSVLITLIGGAAGFAGYFLYNTFYHTAFYVPVYLVLCAVFLLRKRFNKNNIVVLILTLIPFFTAGIALRIYLGASNTGFEKIISDSFGPLSPLLLLLLIVIEIILIMNASLFLKKQPDDKKDIETEEHFTENPSDGLKTMAVVSGDSASGNKIADRTGAADSSDKSDLSFMSMLQATQI